MASLRISLSLGDTAAAQMSHISWHARTYAGTHKQMPLSVEQHQCRQNTKSFLFLGGVSQSGVSHTRSRARGLCKHIYILRSLNLRQNHSAISSHISTCAQLCVHAAPSAQRLCMYSCLQLRAALLPLWCGSRRRAQKASRLMKVAGLRELFHPVVRRASLGDAQHAGAGYKATGKYTCDCHEVIIRQN